MLSIPGLTKGTHQDIWEGGGGRVEVRRVGKRVPRMGLIKLDANRIIFLLHLYFINFASTYILHGEGVWLCRLPPPDHVPGDKAPGSQLEHPI